MVRDLAQKGKTANTPGSPPAPCGTIQVAQVQKITGAAAAVDLRGACGSSENGAGGGRSGSLVRCYTCINTEHVARDCPQRHKGSLSGGGNNLNNEGNTTTGGTSSSNP